MITSSARLFTGHKAPGENRRHEQHTAIMTPAATRVPAIRKKATAATWTPGALLHHPGIGHGPTGARAAHPPPDTPAVTTRTRPANHVSREPHAAKTRRLFRY